MILNELVGKKVVVHVTVGSSVTQHRGVLQAVDANFLKLQKDNETIFFVLTNVVGVAGV
jgi:ferredoxin-fold anticodon binding domain-containing protein